MKGGRVITIVNQKGGVGKTSTAINLSTALAAVGQKILVIDFDSQGNASTGFGISERKPNIYHVITGHADIEEAIRHSLIPQLDIIPADINLSVLEIELVNLKNREFILKRKIAKIIDLYDFIIIDCPPSLGLLTINALVAASSIIIPMQCEFFALEGLSHLLKTYQLVKNNLNPIIKIEGIVFTMYDKRNRLTTQIEEDVRSYLGECVYDTVIPRNVRVSEAPSHGKPVIIYDTKGTASLAYANLAREILNKMKVVI